ncbi:MAG: PepSY-associated TM helix domain-containing protein [Methyloligellaceae bacterium]
MSVDIISQNAPLKTVQKKRRTWTSVAFFVHSASGLWFTLLLSVVLLSGTFTVLFQEIDWLLYEQMRVVPQAERANPGKLYDALKEKYPDVGVNNITVGADNDRLAASAFVLSPDGGFRLIWLDQYRGVVTGDTAFLTPGRFVNLLHTSLFLPVVGRSVVNFFGILLLISLISGLIAYKKFWRGFTKKPRFEKNARTWLGDLHRLVALWAIWFVAVIGFTGSWWFYQNPLVQYAGAPGAFEKSIKPPGISGAELKALGPGTPRRLSAEVLVEKVQQALPDLVVTGLQSPKNASQPFVVQGEMGEVLVPRGGNVVYVNPYSGKIMGQSLVKDWSGVKRFDAAVHPIHYGSWGKRGTADLIVKLVWFLGGCAISFLAISGLIIYMKRTSQAAREMASERSWLRALWSYIGVVLRFVLPWGGPMGVFKYVNILILVGISMGTILVFSLGSRGLEGKGRVFEEKQAGPFLISLRAVSGLLEADLPPIRSGAKVDVFAKVADSRFRDIKFIRIGVAKDEKGTLVEGEEAIAHADVRLPKVIEGAHIWVLVEGWDGESYRASWPLVIRE